MFDIPALPVKKIDVTSLEFKVALQNALDHPRAGLDLRTRHAILSNKSGSLTLRTGKGAEWDDYFNYWSRFAQVLKIKLNRDAYAGYKQFPAYPAPVISVCYFTSDIGNGRGGFESLMMADTLYAEAAFNLLDIDYSEPYLHHLEGFLAILGPAIGAATTFIGDEKFSGPATQQFSTPDAIEQTEWWWRTWNNYLGPRNSIQSVTGAMHKDSIVLAATSVRPLHEIGSCDHKDSLPDGWCGTCWKCISTAYVLWANGRDHTIPVTKQGLDATADEYMTYRIHGTDQFRSLGLFDRVFNNTGKSYHEFRLAHE